MPEQWPGVEQAGWPAGDQPLTSAEIAELDRDLDPADYDLEDLGPDCGLPAGPEGWLASPVRERRVPAWGSQCRRCWLPGSCTVTLAGRGRGSGPAGWRLDGAPSPRRFPDLPGPSGNFPGDIAALERAARPVWGELHQDGRPLTRDALATGLRAVGHPVRNARLTPLLATLRAESAPAI